MITRHTRHAKANEAAKRRRAWKAQGKLLIQQLASILQSIKEVEKVLHTYPEDDIEHILKKLAQAQESLFSAADLIQIFARGIVVMESPSPPDKGLI